MKSDILYSRTSTGAVQTWQYELLGNKFRVTSGQLDGKKVTAEWTVCEGKNIGRSNETTGEQQALAEVTAKMNKKLKTGYSDSRALIDSCVKYVEPMLAKNFKDYEDNIDWFDGVLVQNKFNGFRCVARLEEGRVVLRTRKGEEYLTCPHIAKDLEEFFGRYPEAVLDGELFNNDLRDRLNEMSKLVRRTVNITAEDLEKSRKMVLYYVYDGYGFYGENVRCSEGAGYDIRKACIDAILPKYSKYYRQVDTWEAGNKQDVDEIFERMILDGQEGVIIRMPHSPYEHKRSKLLLKYKPEDDAEATIVDIIEGTGNWSGTGKVVKLRWTNGKTFDATLKGSHEDAVQFLKDKKKWIGKEVTFLYMGLTGLGTPNYARVDYNNCLKG